MYSIVVKSCHSDVTLIPPSQWILVIFFQVSSSQFCSADNVVDIPGSSRSSIIFSFAGKPLAIRKYLFIFIMHFQKFLLFDLTFNNLS